MSAKRGCLIAAGGVIAGGAIVLVVFIVVAWLLFAGSNGEHEVRYEIDGENKSGEVNYATPGNASLEHSVMYGSTNWSRSYKFRGRMRAYVSAEARYCGHFRVTILCDGRRVGSGYNDSSCSPASASARCP